MSSDNIYVLIKSCNQNYYKTLVLVNRKNKNVPKSSENACPPRNLENKNLLKLVLVQPLKRKMQMRQKLLKTLILIKVINGKANKNSGPHKSLEKKYTIYQKIIRTFILCSYIS